MVRAANASAQLMQLGEPEFIGAVDDDGVGGRHVDAGFDDSGTQQNVETLLVKIAHHHFEFALAHLTVGDANARFGQQFEQRFLGLRHAVDIVVQEIHLAAALEFAQHGLPHQPLARARDEGLDRQTALRCGGDHREIAQPFERHTQRARDRCRRQGQYVDFGAQAF